MNPGAVDCSGRSLLSGVPPAPPAMSYEVIARKYRPQTFADVVGQSHLVSTLANAIRTGRVAHAYLFVGPRGTGKTSTARIFAKALNCEKGMSTEPCNVCDSCREITAGNSLDVMEIDGASNNGVEQVRDLRDSARFLPARGRFKIYVIDEVHMLSTGAFNALLKTLEEPPAHVKFIFATTEAHKVPATILSRCQRFDLRRISSREIAERLRHIVSAEGLQADDAALDAIARGADGGMRDAQSALDQLLSSCAGGVTEQDVTNIFGLISQRSLADLAGAVARGDAARVLDLVAEFDASGKDLYRVMTDLLAMLRDVVVYALTRRKDHLADLPEAQARALTEQAAALDPARLLRVVEILVESEGRLRGSLSRRTLLEVILLRACRAAGVASLEELVRQVEQLKNHLGPPDPGSDKKKVVETPPPPAAPPPSSRASSGASAHAAVAVEPRRLPGVSALAELRGNWESVCASIAAVQPLLKGLLVNSWPVELVDGVLAIGLEPRHAPRMPELGSGLQTVAVERYLTRAHGAEFRVRFELLAETPPPVRPAAPSAAPEPAVAARPAPPPSADDLRRWREHPAVRQVVEAFNAKIIRVDMDAGAAQPQPDGDET